MKPIEDMTDKERHNLSRLLTSVELSLKLGEKPIEELISIAIGYWAELPMDSPVSALLGELIERLEEAYNINQEPEEEE